MTFFDSHAHYIDARFAREFDGGADALLTKLFAENVSHIINVGDNLKNSDAAVAQAKKYANMYAAVGIHPSEAGKACDLDTARRRLCDFLDERQENKIVALGEIGFDYHYDDTDKATQADFFAMQMKIAEMYGLPVIIHDRDAHGDSFDMICRFPNVRGVFHSYSGSAELAHELMKRGWMISFSGVVTFANAARVREVCARVPMEKLMIETDCPYLAPHPHRGACNHSGFLEFTAKAVADTHGLTVEEVAEITTKNAIEFFRLGR